MIESKLVETTDTPQFVDRRKSDQAPETGDRRQFSASYSDLSPEAKELGEAIDQYKLLNRRRYLNCDELLSIIQSIGYSR